MINARRLEELFRAPWKISEKDLPGIDKIASEYPWYQVIRVLQLYGSFRFNRVEYDRQVSQLPSLPVDPEIIRFWIHHAGENTSDSFSTHPEREIHHSPSPDDQQENVLNKNAGESSGSSSRKILSDPRVIQKDWEADSAKSKNEQELLNRFSEESCSADSTAKEQASDSSASSGQPFTEEQPYPKSPESMSFLEWLKTISDKVPPTASLTSLTEKENTAGQVYSPSTSKIRFDEKKRKKQQDLVDKIIRENPGPIKIKPAEHSLRSFPDPEKNARQSLLESEDFVTETLAILYYEQGHFSKAIRVYEILSLKIPSKSAYFAEKIKEIKGQIKS